MCELQILKHQTIHNQGSAICTVLELVLELKALNQQH